MWKLWYSLSSRSLPWKVLRPALAFGTSTSPCVTVRVWLRPGKSHSMSTSKRGAPAGTSVLKAAKVASHSSGGSGGADTRSRTPELARSFWTCRAAQPNHSSAQSSETFVVGKPRRDVGRRAALSCQNV